MPLFNGTSEEIREDLFAEVNYHAGRDVMRAVRTNRYNFIRILDENPNVVLVNIDAGPSKDVVMRHGLGNHTVREQVQLYDLSTDPQERHNVANDPAHHAARIDMEKRLHEWMTATADPAIHSPVAAPDGAVIERRDQIDPS